MNPIRKRGLQVTIVLVLLAVVVAACAPARQDAVDVAPPEDTGSSRGGENVAVEEGASEPAARDDTTDGESGASMPPAATGTASDFAYDAVEAEESVGEPAPELAGRSDADAAAGDMAMPPAGTNPEYTPPDRQFQGPLQAGEIDDNADFDEYIQYRTDFQKFLGYPVSDADVSERHVIRVTTRNGGRPVLGAQVFIYDGQSLVTALRTTADGTVRFFPLAYPAHAGARRYDVRVEKDQARADLTIERSSGYDYTWDMTLNTRPAQAPVQLDVLFLLDATGSMSDEINQLKDNILSISAQIEALPGRPDVRFGLVHYRDRGDNYVTRTTDFTGNVRAFQRELSAVEAGGGGDDPESMNEALHQAVNNVDWRVEDTVSLVFLVADAPPHLDYSQDYNYADEMKAAAELGIKVFPIGSRLDGGNAYQQQAEYILRQIGQFTGGHFIFLTYEDTPRSDGAPGTEYSVPEEQYTVEDLDALVVRLVQDELEALTGQQ